MPLSNPDDEDAKSDVATYGGTSKPNRCSVSVETKHVYCQLPPIQEKWVKYEVLFRDPSRTSWGKLQQREEVIQKITAHRRDAIFYEFGERGFQGYVPDDWRGLCIERKDSEFAIMVIRGEATEPMVKLWMIVVALVTVVVSSLGWMFWY